MNVTLKPLNANDGQFLKITNRMLFWVLLLMVAGFFTWSENVMITRVIKVVGRMGVMISSYFIYKRIINYGAANTVIWNNVFAPGLYFGYLALGFASFMWSTNVSVSALQWFMTFQSMVFSFFFIKSLFLLDAYFPTHTIRLYNLLGNSVFVLMLVFVIGMFVSPDVFFRLTHGGEEARLGGYIMNPNELGMLAGVGIACLVFDIYRDKNKWFTIFKILILFYGLFMTGSRSSLIGVLLIIFFHVNQSKHTKIKIAIIAGVLMALPFAVNTIILKGDPERLEEVLSMTGRLPFWKALINESLPREPLLGFGFMRIDYNEYFQGANTYAGKMTHNTFIQVLMNLGFVGLTLVFFQMLFTIIGIMSENNEKKLMLFGIMIPIIINSFTEFGIFGESNYGILFYQLIVFSVAFKTRTYLTKPERAKLMVKKRIEADWVAQIK